MNRVLLLDKGSNKNLLPSTLTLLSWNVGKKPVAGFLEESEQFGAHVVCLQEVNAGLGVGRTTGWQEYIHLAPRGRGRGVAIYIKAPLSNCILRQGADCAFRILWVDVGASAQDSTRLICAYAPLSTAPPPERASFLSSLQQVVATAPSRYIIAGDLNTVMVPELDSSSHSSYIPRQPELIKAILLEGLAIDAWRVLHPRSTQYTHQIGTQGNGNRIDFILVSASLWDSVSTCEIQNALGSDHLPITLGLGNFLLGALAPVQHKLLHRKLQLIGANKKALETQLRLLQRTTPAPRDWSVFVRMRKLEDQLVRCLRTHLNQTPHYERISSNRSVIRPQAWWVRKFAAGSLARMIRQKQPTVTFLRQANGDLIVDPYKVQQQLALELQAAGGPVKASVPSEFFDRLTSSMPCMESGPLPLLSLVSLRSLLQGAKKDSSTGPEGVNLWLLSQLNDEWLGVVLEAANTVLEGAALPERWNSVEIILLHKGGDPFESNNFRPLSMCSALYKVIAAHLRNFIRDWAERGHLLSEEQAGFRRGHSTSEHLWTTLGRLSTSPTTPTLLVDVRKAFDSVIHSCLFALLRKLGLDESVVSIIERLYTGVICYPVVQGQVRASYTLGRGIRQGCPLSPVLFLLYAEPWLRCLKQRLPWVVFMMFADDLAALLRQPVDAVVIMNLLHELSPWGFTVNISKSALAMSTPGDPLVTNAGLLQCTNLEKARYLGISLAPGSLPLAEQTQMARVREWLYSLRGWHFPPRVLISLINAIVIPKLVYQSRYLLPLATKQLDDALWRLICQCAFLPIHASLASRHLPPEQGGLGLRSIHKTVATLVAQELGSLAAGLGPRAAVQEVGATLSASSSTVARLLHQTALTLQCKLKQNTEIAAQIPAEWLHTQTRTSLLYLCRQRGIKLRGTATTEALVEMLQRCQLPPALPMLPAPFLPTGWAYPEYREDHWVMQAHEWLVRTHSIFKFEGEVECYTDGLAPPPWSPYKPFTHLRRRSFWPFC